MRTPVEFRKGDLLALGIVLLLIVIILAFFPEKRGSIPCLKVIKI